MSHPRLLIVAGEASQATVLERYVGTGAAFTNAVGEVWLGAERRGRPLQAAGRAGRFVPHRQHVPALRAQRHVLVALAHVRRRPRPQRRRGDARRRRHRLHAERPVRRPRHAADRQPHDDRPRDAALRQPRDLQGHPRRSVARGLQRQDHRAPRRAEDRREADEQGAAAVGRREHQLEARARDLRQRRQVHARRGHRPAR